MPSLASSASPGSDWTTSTSPKDASVTASAGNLILVLGGTEDAGATLNVPSDGTNSYTTVTSSAVAAYCAGYAWTTGIVGLLAVTTTTLPAATIGIAYTTVLAASGGTGSGQAWTVVSGTLPAGLSLSSGGVISGTPTTAGTSAFTVMVTDSGSNTATQPLSLTVSSASLQPVGPGGTWTLLFDDQFAGASLDTTRWTAVNTLGGTTINSVPTSAANVTVSGGNCVLTLASGSSGACIDSKPSLQGSGWGGGDPSNGVTVGLGDCCEARISIPGTSGSSQYNWPAWWISGGNWPANGEEDIVEGYDSSLSALNYHSSGGANNGPHPTGNYVNSFHTYTLVRGSSTLQVWWDGVLMRSVARSDSGGPQSLIINVGVGNAVVSGTASQVLVDYVRVWTPG